MSRTASHTRFFGLFVFGLGAFFYCYEYFLRIGPSVMSEQLMKAFAIDATSFGGLTAFYLYAYTPLQLVVGMVVDRFKLRHVLPLAILFCAGGSLVIASADQLEQAAIGRFLQGTGSAFAFVAMIKLVALWLPKERFAFFIGLGSTLGFLGAAFGEAALGEVVNSLGWRHVLIIFSGMGGVLLLAFIAALYSPAGKKPTGGEGHHVGCVSDCLRQLRDVATHPRVWGAGAISFLMFLPTSVLAELWGVPFFQKLNNYPLSKAAILDSMIFIGWAIGSPLAGHISDRLQRRARVITVGSALACGLILIALYVPGISFPVLSAMLIAFGMFSATQSLTFVIASDVSVKSAVGTAVAFINMLAMLGGMIFQRGVGMLLDAGWQGETVNGVRVYTVQDYQRALVVIPICLALACLISILIRDTTHHRRESATNPQVRPVV
ncbi:MFS transporter [Desulfovibrio inopinatus]|uniref:MFS transporter n=1 Tax=Desulfovibrio inopinatus TaxID=102109 RepID=UPI000425468D|nr:MFS transporter [Desulfovibrio inopinatus]